MLLVFGRLGTVIANPSDGSALRRQSRRADKTYLPFLSTPHREGGRHQAAAFICGPSMFDGLALEVHCPESSSTYPCVICERGRSLVVNLVHPAIVLIAQSGGSIMRV